MEDLSQSLSGMIMKRYQDEYKKMRLKYEGKEPCTITDSGEVIALAVLAGAELDFIYQDGMMTTSTKHDCGASWDGEKFNFFNRVGQSKDGV